MVSHRPTDLTLKVTNQRLHIQMDRDTGLMVGFGPTRTSGSSVLYALDVSTVNSESSVNLTGMSLDCRRKLKEE